MPLYEYECLKCGERFEIIQKFSDDPVVLHAEHRDAPCDGPVRKLLAAPAIRFKGSGWYVTDYGKGSKESQAENGESKAKKDSKSKDSAKKARPPAKDGKPSASAAA